MNYSNTLNQLYEPYNFKHIKVAVILKQEYKCLVTESYYRTTFHALAYPQYIIKDRYS